MPVDKKALLKKQKDAASAARDTVLTTNQSNLDNSEATLMTYSPDRRAIKALHIANTRLTKNESGLMTIALDDGSNVVLSDLFLSGEKLSDAARLLIRPGAVVLIREVKSAAPAQWSKTAMGVQLKNSWMQIYAAMSPEQEDHWRKSGLLA
jgi:hypothetical protein